ncbi:MAG: hypothetical protein FWG63_03485 [Defluviitaleaceae bacterium]|nr:hypothetical protein [Defluviitaleaceae bacterium]
MKIFSKKSLAMVMALVITLGTVSMVSATDLWPGGGWSGTLEDGTPIMWVVDENGQEFRLNTLEEHVASLPQSRVGINPLETAIGIVFSDDKSIADVAHLNLEEQTLGHVKDLILQARYQIVFADDISWTVNQAIEIHNGDGSITTLPEFHDLFPSDWYLPAIEEANAYQGIQPVGYENISGLSQLVWSNLVSIPVVNHNQQAPVFQNFHNNTGYAATIAISVQTISLGGPTVSIGITQGAQSVGWASGLMAGQNVRATAPAGAVFGLRASMTQMAGQALLAVHRI